MSATPFRAEMIAFINDALRYFQAQLVADTRSHFHEVLEDLLLMLPTMVSTALST